MKKFLSAYGFALAMIVLAIVFCLLVWLIAHEANPDATVIGTVERVGPIINHVFDADCFIRVRENDMAHDLYAGQPRCSMLQVGDKVMIVHFDAHGWYWAR